MVDELHALHLGVHQEFVKCVVWCILQAGAWGSAQPSEHERYEAGVLIMRNELTQWYKDHEREHRDGLTRVHDITLRSLGSKTNRKLQMSGAETWGFLLYLVSCLGKHLPRLPPEAKALNEAGDLFVRMQKVFGNGQTNLPVKTLQDSRWSKTGLNNKCVGVCAGVAGACTGVCVSVGWCLLV